MKIMFLDESGDHSLSAIDSQYPMFVLGGIIVEQSYANGELDEQVRKFKRDLFGRDDLVLHTADITRNRNGFESLADPAFRLRFYRDLNRLMRELHYTVVACAIRKDRHLAQYGLAAIDPYMLSLTVLIERFCFELGSLPRGGAVIAEKRDRTLDRELQLAWLALKTRGTRYFRATQIGMRIESVTCHDKRENLSGLQLADLVVSPIGRFVLGKPVKEDFRIIESKFRRRNRGGYCGMGLVVLPKE